MSPVPPVRSDEVRDGVAQVGGLLDAGRDGVLRRRGQQPDRLRPDADLDRGAGRVAVAVDGDGLAGLEPGAAVGVEGRAQQVGGADEVGHEARGRALVELLGRPELLDLAGVHDRDPVAHRERLLLVVGHVHERDPDLRLDALELDLELAAELEVQGAERLVEQQHVRAVGERAGERHPLLLAAGELVGLALLECLEPDQRQGVADAPSHLVLGHALALGPEGDVVADRQVRKQRVVLEHHVHGPLVGWLAGHVAVAQQDAAARRQLEAADHPQGRRLAAARWAQEREELAGGHLEGHVVDG